MYPQNEEQAVKFSAGIIESLHSEETRPKIMQQLTSEQIPIPARIASVVANVMTAMLQRVSQQSGEKPHLQLLLKAIKMTVQEVSRMAMAAGIKVTKADQKEAARIAGDMIENGQTASQQPMQEPEQQPVQEPVQGNGLLGGAR